MSDLFTGKELRYLGFFRENSVSQMSAFFPNTFWRDQVPQIAHAEPSIRHALLAFASFHEHFTLGGGSRNDHTRFGLQQCNLAIKGLVQSSQGSPLIALLCCLLFISIEVSSWDGPREPDD